MFGWQVGQFGFFSRLGFRYRLTLLFALVFGAGLTLFGVSLYSFLTQTLQQEFDDALYNYGVDVLDSIKLSNRGALLLTSPDFDREKIYPFPLGTALIQIRQISGTVLTRVRDFKGFDPPYVEDFKRLARGEDFVYRTVRVEMDPSANRYWWSDWFGADEARTYRILNFPVDDSPHPQLVLQIAVPRSALDAQLEKRRQLFLYGLPLVLLLIMAGSYFMSSRALQPIQSIIDTATGIDPSRLSDRVPVPVARDELQGLALALNLMLDRIEKAFRSQERFVADASHQLLTPLSVLKTEIEGRSREGVLSEALRDEFLAEIDQLAGIVKDMLLLARVDAGVGALNFQIFSLDELIVEALSRLERNAKKKSVRLKFDIGGQVDQSRNVRGDYDLLLNLVVNLIENAIKFSKADSVVVVFLQWSEEKSLLMVRDQGPGLDAEMQPRLFERFSRGSQHSQVSGYGLGLAIARKIADLHDAILTAENGPNEGAVFSFEIKNF